MTDYIDFVYQEVLQDKLSPTSPKKIKKLENFIKFK